MSLSNLNKLINANDRGDVIDLQAITVALGISIKKSSELKDYCHVFFNEEGRAVIQLKSDLSNSLKKTLVAVAAAEYVLTPERLAGQGIKYDMFFLKELYSQKYSYRMLLASRLVLPESVIEKIVAGEVLPALYAEKIGFEPDFIKNVVQHDSAVFLVENFSDNSPT